MVLCGRLVGDQERKGNNMGLLTDARQLISTIGYNYQLPQLGIGVNTTPGTPYSVANNPQQVSQGTNPGLTNFYGGAISSPQVNSTPTNIDYKSPGLNNNTPSSSTNSGGQVLSGQTSNPSGPDFSGMSDQAKSQAQIDLENAMNEFNYQRENLNAQSGQLDQQRLSALGTIDTSRGQAQKEAETAKKEATTLTESAKSKALSTAQDVVKKNRNVLRALGILSSSAGGEMLTRPMTEYGSQAAELQQGLIDRIGKVEQWFQDRTKDFDTAKTQIEQQYANLKENIMRDLRFTGAQQATAVRAASAALQQRLADIENQKAQYAQVAQQNSNNLLLQIAQMKMYQNPSADVSAIYNTLLSQAQSNAPQQVATTLTDEQRRKQQGLLSGY